MALLELSLINIENFSKIKAVERARLTAVRQTFLPALKMLEASFICLRLISSVGSTLESQSLDEPLGNRETKR